MIDLLQGTVRTSKQVRIKVKPTEMMKEVQLTENLVKESVDVSVHLAHAACLLQATRVPARDPPIMLA